MGTFAKSAHFYVPKMTFPVPNKNSETTFICPTCPKNDEITFGFKRLPLLVKFLANSKYA